MISKAQNFSRLKLMNSKIQQHTLKEYFKNYYKYKWKLKFFNNINFCILKKNYSHLLKWPYRATTGRNAKQISLTSRTNVCLEMGTEKEKFQSVSVVCDSDKCAFNGSSSALRGIHVWTVYPPFPAILFYKFNSLFLWWGLSCAALIDM